MDKVKAFFLSEIGQELNIHEVRTIEGTCQVLYSIAGRMALSSLWDQNEMGTRISKEYFCNRIREIYNAYTEIIPTIKRAFPGAVGPLCKELYSTYLKTGHIYQENGQLAPCMASHAQLDNVYFFRGLPPERHVSMSGLGLYLKDAQQSGMSLTVRSLFGLREQTLDDYLDESVEAEKWRNVHIPKDADFLHINAPGQEECWKKVPERNGAISLVKYNHQDTSFAIYQISDKGKYWQRNIPKWRVQDFIMNDDGEYRRIIAALSRRNGILRDIQVEFLKENRQVLITLPQRLPPSEEAFFKLYSWPLAYRSLPENYERKMAIEVYPALKNTLTSLGYTLVEK